MPGGWTGHQIAEKMRGEKPALRVIFTSGYSVEIAGREISRLHGDAFLAKPFSLKSLLETVRKCLDQDVEDSG